MVLVVWSQFDTWRAVLTENDAGLLMPFNIAVVEDGESTRIAIANWNHRRDSRPTVGISLMLHDAELKLRRVFARCDPEDHVICQQVQNLGVPRSLTAGRTEAAVNW